MPRRARPRGGSQDEDLFSVARQPMVRHQLAGMRWPPAERFLVNHAAASVRAGVWGDLVESPDALVVAGFASIASVVELAAGRAQRRDPGRLRVVLGTEPYGTDRVDFRSPAAAFTVEARRYWVEERGVSLRLSAKIVQAIGALDAGTLQARYVPGAHRLHAKIFLTERAVTLGSSNFTQAGLQDQLEANVRFRPQDEPDRYREAAEAAENFWRVGLDWNAELRALLEDLLQFVSWEEALARACADLLEGEWAAGYLGGARTDATLWPSQLAGIAQAMWVVENVGSVLVADATGSGKTRMGAHLTRAVRDRLWSTGRVRGDLTVLVCPPAVEQQWLREAAGCGLTMRTVSQGLLSRPAAGGRVQEEEVGKAQILAVDEAHNFLAPGANRTRHVREATADHVLLFTATPINRGAADLLSLVDLLGADNFADETLELLDSLARQRQDVPLTDPQQALLRREIQRFTVRRTKSALNALVEQDPAAYRHPVTGRICRYPSHDPHVYPTGETAGDQELARLVRDQAAGLRGLSLLGEALVVPAALRGEYTDERWLDLRLGAAAGLAAHHVLAAMRSSTAALLEHLVGTVAAVEALGIHGLAKPQPTGDVLGRLRELRRQGPPRVELACPLPPWLTTRDGWAAECGRELARYTAIHAAAAALSDARERAKAGLLLELAARHPRVLAFDRHPISLASIARFLDPAAVPVTVASGANAAARRAVPRLFASDSDEPGIALCTDALSEGLNLQGASVIVHLDLPTTLRVAEQRVGRVDRMDSRHDVIEAWWPGDGEAFATRANELLTARNAESAALLGSNLPIPDLPGPHLPGPERTGSRAPTPTTPAPTSDPVDVRRVAEAVETPSAEVWDGIHDALDPVRRLVTGPDALLTEQQYASHKTSGRRVVARVSTVAAAEPWAFFAARGHAHGAPRWMLLTGPGATVLRALEDVTRGLHDRLVHRPPSLAFDEHCESWLEHFLRAAARAEAQLLPRRLQRALEQMHDFGRRWAQQARGRGEHEVAERWEAITRLAGPGDEDVPIDPYQVAERWLQLVQPRREQARRVRRSRYSKLGDIDPSLRDQPLNLSEVEARLGDLRRLEPFDQRISACILGVPPVA